MTNSTFAGNSAGSSGGGIFNESTLTVSNSTINGNRAVNGGGIHNYTYAEYAGTVTLQNTIVANSPTGRNCTNAITDGGGNLSYPDATCPGINSDPKLGPLQDNGGPTWTMALLPGSAAIDTADDAICAAPPVNNLDQRGVARPQGPHCDIGAYEAMPPPRLPAAHPAVAHSQLHTAKWPWAAQFNARGASKGRPPESHRRTALVTEDQPEQRIVRARPRPISGSVVSPSHTAGRRRRGARRGPPPR